MSKETNMRLRKIIFKIPLSSFCVGYLVLGINPILRCETLINIYKHSWDSIGTNRFYLCKQLLDSLLGFGVHVYFSLSFICLRPYKPCAGFLSLCCVWKALFLWFTHHLWVLQSFHLFVNKDHWALRGGSWWLPIYDKVFPVPSSQALWISFSCGSLFYFPSSAAWSFPDDVSSLNCHQRSFTQQLMGTDAERLEVKY